MRRLILGLVVLVAEGCTAGITGNGGGLAIDRGFECSGKGTLSAIAAVGVVNGNGSVSFDCGSGAYIGPPRGAPQAP